MMCPVCEREHGSPGDLTLARCPRCESEGLMAQATLDGGTKPLFRKENEQRGEQLMLFTEVGVRPTKTAGPLFKLLKGERDD